MENPFKKSHHEDILKYVTSDARFTENTLKNYEHHYLIIVNKEIVGYFCYNEKKEWFLAICDGLYGIPSDAWKVHEVVKTLRQLKKLLKSLRQ